jgi:hypothetical protein
MPLSITVKPQGRPVALAKSLPATVSFSDKTISQVTIEEVKGALQAKFPRVRIYIYLHVGSLRADTICLVPRFTPEALSRRLEKDTVRREDHC